MLYEVITNLAAMVLLHSGKGRAWFSQTSDWPGPRAAAFILTAALLALTRAKTPFPVLLADRFLPGSGFLEILGLAYYASWAVAALRRITSYNVCYTKLLRWLFVKLKNTGRRN